MVSIVPNPYVIAHITRAMTTEKDPDTGNDVMVDFPPVIRPVQAFAQIGRTRASSKQIISVEFAKRVETALHMMVPDPSLYHPMDQVLLFPEVDADGEYVPGSGVAFWVDGMAIDARQSPWPQLTKIFGGIVEIHRVT
jgi:hypothetical protein